MYIDKDSRNKYSIMDLDVSDLVLLTDSLIPWINEHSDVSETKEVKQANNILIQLKNSIKHDTK